MNVHAPPPDDLSNASPLEETIRRQQRASDPKHSAWVSANAGSGKTTVLANRVVRLLLMGTEPARILCLTYTKAAAAEMSNRIFGTLARWALLDDAALVAAIESVQGFAPQPDRLSAARTLFARSLETPGGLKIQTIHAFCEGILHQFPLEANVPSHFTVLQDEPQARMLQEARAAMWVAAHEGGDAALAEAATGAMEHASDTAIAAALSEAIARREHVEPWLAEAGDARMAARRALLRFGFQEDDTADTIAAGFRGPMGHDALRALLGRALAGRAKADATFAEALEPALAADDPALVFEACRSVMLTATGTVRKTIVSKAVAGDDADALAAQGEAVRDTLARMRTLETIRRSGDLFTLAHDVIHRYERMKRAGGFLDFDDLIARTGDLLERSEAASWVHYKLDRGLHHVLVDEAQDTSPRQWRIVGKLVEEFFAGEGAVEPDDVGTGVERTLFAVGDEKQSIYSFQGARPEEFDRQRRHYLAAAREAGDFDEHEFDVPLSLSFRSTQDVLEAVDIVFRHGDHGKGLTSGTYQPHQTARGAAPGSVDIWELARPDTMPEPEDWTAPIDQVGGGHQTVLAAQRIAEQIEDWIAKGETLEATGLPIRPRDILVLVRARDQFVTALTRALKLRDVPVAGADRLVLTDHIAVKDLVALGRTVLLPEDDLSLAEVLKSPLFDLSEDALYRLAQGREGSLDAALAASTDHVIEAAELASWRELADRVPVHDFYARVLGPDGGRGRLYRRLGQEAEDVIDAFLQAALDYETTGPGGLQGFVAAMSDSDQQIKREMDTVRDEVRIMTVHGAKGLEAPVVFLVDKASSARGGGGAPSLYEWRRDGEGGFLWVPSKGDHTPETERLALEIEEGGDAEYRRLLYVAMTRAADRLIVTGYRGRNEPSQPTWHDMISAALLPFCEELDGADGHTFHRFQLQRDEPWVPGKKEPDAAQDDARVARPAWMRNAVAPEADVPRPLTPSGAQALIENEALRGATPTTLVPDAEALPRRIGEIARRRGTLVHRLLQSLPDMAPEARRGTASRYLRSTLSDSSEAQIEALVDEVMGVLDAPATRDLLAAGRAEVAVMGRLDMASGERMITGQIDRLHVSDAAVTVIDYKTNRVVPRLPEDVPAEYVAQLALYRALVARLYPDRPVRCVLVWTHASGGPLVMELPDAMLERALRDLEAA